MDIEGTRNNGEKFRDNVEGEIVYVDGKNVVIDGRDGNMSSWGDQTEGETSKKVSDMDWDPID